MLKLPLGASAIALTLALGAPPLSADQWRGDTPEYRVHDQTRHYYMQRGHSWREHEHSYYPQPRSYDHGYARRSIYNAGFNAGAEAQWRIAYQRWAYEYAAYRQWRGPTGIFALGGGLGGGAGYGGAGYGGGYGRRCDCD
jgi:hypothetical protein